MENWVSWHFYASLPAEANSEHKQSYVA